MTVTAPAFEVVAETVVMVDDTDTLAVGDMVRIADGAVTAYGGYIDSSAFGKVGEIVNDTYRVSDGLAVRHEGTWGTTTTYVAEEHLTKVSELEILREQVTKLTEERDSAKTLLTKQADEFAAWKDNLQQVAYEAAEANDMCGVFDRVMEEVGLEGRERSHSIRVEFDGSVWLDVRGTSRARAADSITTRMVTDAIHNTYSSFDLNDWNFEDTDD